MVAQNTLLLQNRRDCLITNPNSAKVMNVKPTHFVKASFESLTP